MPGPDGGQAEVRVAGSAQKGRKRVGIVCVPQIRRCQFCQRRKPRTARPFDSLAVRVVSQVDFLFPFVTLLRQTLGSRGSYLRPRGLGAAGGAEPASPSAAHAPPGGLRVALSPGMAPPHPSAVAPRALEALCWGRCVLELLPGQPQLPRAPRWTPNRQVLLFSQTDVFSRLHQRV